MKHVTFDEYASAITRLLPVAQRDTGQSGTGSACFMALARMQSLGIRKRPRFNVRFYMTIYAKESLK